MFKPVGGGVWILTEDALHMAGTRLFVHMPTIQEFGKLEQVLRNFAITFSGSAKFSPRAKSEKHNIS